MLILIIGLSIIYAHSIVNGSLVMVIASIVNHCMMPNKVVFGNKVGVPFKLLNS